MVTSTTDLFSTALLSFVMHPDLSPHLHSEECNVLIMKLNECHKNKKIGKWFGVCNEIDFLLNKCLKREMCKCEYEPEDGTKHALDSLPLSSSLILDLEADSNLFYLEREVNRRRNAEDALKRRHKFYSNS